MKRTVVGVFDHFQNAERVVSELGVAGVARDRISLITPDERGRSSQELPGPSAQHPNEKDALTERVGVGAAAGGIGGLLLSLAALAIPGIGPVLAAGPLLAAIGGAAAGGLVGALSTVGISEEDAHFYAESLRRGSSIISVEADEQRADRVVEIMTRFGAVDIEKRALDYRSEGFSSFDESRAPLTLEELVAERDRTLEQTPSGRKDPFRPSHWPSPR